MRLVVLESPYAAREGRTVEEHVGYARRCLVDCLRRGESPIASHLLYPQVLDDLEARERALGIGAGIAWHHVSDLVAFYTDLGWSGGMKAAYHYAGEHGLRRELRALNGAPLLPV